MNDTESNRDNDNDSDTPMFDHNSKDDFDHEENRHDSAHDQKQTHVGRGSVSPRGGDAT